MCPCVRASLCSLCAQWLWWEGWSWNEHRLCLLSRCAGSFHPGGGNRLELDGLRTGARCEWGSLPYWGVGPGLKELQQEPWGSWASSWWAAVSTLVGDLAGGAQGLKPHFWVRSGCPSRSVARPAPRGHLSLPGARASWQWRCLPQRRAEGLGDMLGQTGQAGQSTGQFPSRCLHAGTGSKDVCARSLGEGFSFLTALWGLPLVCKPNKGAQLPGVRPQGWGA